MSIDDDDRLQELLADFIEDNSASEQQIEAMLDEFAGDQIGDQRVRRILVKVDSHG
ncbi:MAG: hypothetical protein IH991_21340, partial [Planctomycetes bacterium]|nr:hypothetical protein [Planctomycetota bacterium]